MCVLICSSHIHFLPPSFSFLLFLWETVVYCEDWTMRLLLASFLWNEWMIGCGIGVKGAKGIGEMLEINGSLMKLNLRGESLMNIHSFHSLITYAWMEYVHPCGWVICDDMLMFVVCICGLQSIRSKMKASFELQKDWRRILHWKNCYSEVCFFHFSLILLSHL